jgi:hypothetical protein
MYGMRRPGFSRTACRGVPESADGWRPCRRLDRFAGNRTTEKWKRPQILSGPSMSIPRSPSPSDAHLMTNDPNYEQWRAEIEARFATMRAIDEFGEIHHSPSGRYSLQITEYAAGEPSWHYSRGLVRRVDSAHVVADVKRNYGAFWFAWVQRNGREYLLCGEDYQGYNVIDLDSGANVLTFPDAAFRGLGFCWVAAHPSPKGDTIAVEGCFWACPYELVFYDFSNPACSPLPELFRVDDVEQVEGWINDGEFRFTVGNGEAGRSETWQRRSAGAV